MTVKINYHLFPQERLCSSQKQLRLSHNGIMAFVSLFSINLIKTIQNSFLKTLLHILNRCFVCLLLYEITK